MEQTRSKGLAFDFESYGAAQFRFEPVHGCSFAATAAALARQRGAQFVPAGAGEFPDAVLLALWLNSVHFKAGASDAPEAVLAAARADATGFFPSKGAAAVTVG